MPFKVTSQKNGQDYYLYSKSTPNGKFSLFLFLPVLNPDALDAIPDGYVVLEDSESEVPRLVKSTFAAKLVEAPTQTEERRQAAERRLGVAIPPALQAIENVALDDYGEEAPFQDICLWLNAACDRFLPIEEWELASENNWFESFVEGEIVTFGGAKVEKYIPEHPETNLHLLVIIARHSESQLCFDYRECGPAGTPKVSYIDVTYEPMRSTTVCESAVEFVAAVLRTPHSKLGH